MAMFKRVKSYSVDALENGLLEAKGTFSDNVHKINLTLHVKLNTGEIVWAKAEMVKVPHSLCYEAQGQDANLIGLSAGPGLRKALQTTVGHSHGCTHIADLAVDIMNTITYTYFEFEKRGLTEEETERKFLPFLDGSCHRWTVTGEGHRLM
jgi:hypothetical protein